MSKIGEYLRNNHIRIALAAGSSIIMLAYFSKHVLPAPIGSLWLALPPFIGTIYESLLGKYKGSRITMIWPWIATVFLSTAMVIFFHR